MGSSTRSTLHILAADDSAVMRRVLKTIFDLHGEAPGEGLPPMKLCEIVRDGIECLEAVERLRPDVLLLDLEMPRMNGIEVLKRLRTVHPSLPVIMCSAYTEVGARSTLEALACGAKDYVMKPSQQSDFASALDHLMEQLLPKIAALASSESSRPVLVAPRRTPLAPEPPVKRPAREEATPASAATETGPAGRSLFGPSFQVPAVRRSSSPATVVMAPAPSKVRVMAPNPAARVEILVIGISTGGPSALELMLPQLASSFPVPILIVQHMPKLFTGVLADRLDRRCALRVQEATGNEVLEPGTIWLAPGDSHMEIALGSAGSTGEGDRRRPRRACVHLNHDAPYHHCRPSVDYLFRSAARLYAGGVLALVMTGMGADGLEGGLAIHAAGGQVLAQDEASSAVWGMPGQIAHAGIASAILPLTALAGELTRRVGTGRSMTQAGSGGAQRYAAPGGSPDDLESSTSIHTTPSSMPDQDSRREATYGLL